MEQYSCCLYIHLSLLLKDFPGIVQVDMITPMCSQLTYEGLLDEVKLIFLELLWICVVRIMSRQLFVVV